MQVSHVEKHNVEQSSTIPNSQSIRSTTDTIDPRSSLILYQKESFQSNSDDDHNKNHDPPRSQIKEKKEISTNPHDYRDEIPKELKRDQCCLRRDDATSGMSKSGECIQTPPHHTISMLTLITMLAMKGMIGLNI